ncbi:hypothetical protein ECSTEC7V_2893 [Escherichia coli STEC_7v]|nr:hypothetical protein ECSTEC7V_2893 [Escherichia coli STEC_7v]
MRRSNYTPDSPIVIVLPQRPSLAARFLFAGISPACLSPADDQRLLHDGLRPALPSGFAAA